MLSESGHFPQNRQPIYLSGYYLRSFSWVKEVKADLFDICDNKAPGPDGYTTKKGRMLGKVNATLITLVPKSSTPKIVFDYRPIACCNVLYKIISKILTNRIKNVLCKLVDPSQSAFIPCRQITDNILLVQELLKGYNRKNDDLLVLCYGNLKSVQVIKRAMVTFSSISGLNPNIGKSTSFFGNVQDNVKQAILSILPFQVGRLSVSYLGVPLITKQRSFTDCKCLIDRVKAKVNNWLNRMLSYAGRLQLITSILSSMQVYWALVFILPKTVIKDIDKLFKGFLWCQGDLSKGKAKIAWKQVCRTKEERGLGIKDLSKWNEVLMSKHLWNVATMKESIWVKWINNNRLNGSSIWEIECDNNASSGWKSILGLIRQNETNPET
ncbi:reverse transcriptase domain, reverse transcriptase zinc-binding domain protein [Tanacetum coccineum]